MPFWSHPTHAPPGYRPWCGCPQPLAPLVSPGEGLGPHCCATWPSACGNSPPWQSSRTLPLICKKIHLADPKMRPQKIAPLELIVDSTHGYAMYPEPPQVSPGKQCTTPSEDTHVPKKFPCTLWTETTNFCLLLDDAPSWGVVRKHQSPLPIPYSARALGMNSCELL